MSRKILYSPTYGAGWSSWQYKVPTNFACEYQPIIDAVEQGESLTEDHPIIQQYVEECQETFDIGHVCVLAADSLAIYQLEDEEKYQISEYDGSESVKIKNSQEWY